VNQGKAERTHALAAAYGLLQPSLVRLVAPKEATVQQLTEFHDADYLERLTDSKPQPKKPQPPEKRNIFGMKMGTGSTAHPPYAACALCVVTESAAAARGRLLTNVCVYDVAGTQQQKKEKKPKQKWKPKKKKKTRSSDDEDSDDEGSDDDSSDDDSSASSSSSSSDSSSEEEIRDGDEEFGLQHDCTPFPGYLPAVRRGRSNQPTKLV